MMDVSDGLLLDLWRLTTHERRRRAGLRRSRAGPPGRRDERGTALDRALSEGEDFELLFTMAPARFRAVWREGGGFRRPITAIGEIVPRGFTIVEDGVETEGASRVGSSIVERTSSSASPRPSSRRSRRRSPRSLAAGDRIALYGDLGAGKTVFVRGLARGLRHPEPREVVSPTFAIHNRYEGGRLALDHLDLYRLPAPVSLEREGLDTVLADRTSVLCCEWAERLARAASRARPRGPDRRSLGEATRSRLARGARTLQPAARLLGRLSCTFSCSLAPDAVALGQCVARAAQ